MKKPAIGITVVISFFSSICFSYGDVSKDYTFSELSETPLKGDIFRLEQRISQVETSLLADKGPSALSGSLSDLGKAPLYNKLAELDQRLSSMEQQADSGSRVSRTFENLDSTPLKKKIEELDWRISTLAKLANEKAGRPSPASMPVDLGDIHFGFNSAVISSTDRITLDKIADQLNMDQSGREVIVSGYASSDGLQSYNQKLSQKRAEAVRDYLVSKEGIAPENVKAAGYGIADPISSNATRSGRNSNRRVKVMVQ